MDLEMWKGPWTVGTEDKDSSTRYTPETFS